MQAAEQLRLNVGAKRVSASRRIDLADAMIAALGGDAPRFTGQSASLI
jgi:hypothetical protein